MPEIDLTCCAVSVVHGGFLLVAGEYFESVAERVEVTHMERITVSQSRGVQTLAVVVDDHRAVDDFIPSVHIHIGYTVVVVALSEVRTAVTFPVPPLCE